MIQGNKTVLLTRKAAAEYLGIKEQTLSSWATSKRVALPFVKVGRRAMYRLADIEQFIESNLVMGAAA